MEKNKNSKVVNYQDDPQNFEITRSNIKDVMDNAKNLLGDFKQISELDIIQERFMDRSKEITGALSQMIWTLGEMYGYCLADDVIESRNIEE